MINALRLSETEILVSEAKIEFLHKDKAEFNSAYKLRERASVLLKLPIRYGTKEATLEIFDEACTNTLHKSNATWQGREGNFDHFKFNICIMLK